MTRPLGVRRTSLDRGSCEALAKVLVSAGSASFPV